MAGRAARVPQEGASWAPRASARLYVSLLLTGSVAGLWAGYLWPNQVVFKGQAPAVLVPLALYVASFISWLYLARRRVARGWLLAFLVALSAAWAVNLVMFYVHGDLFTHLVWLFVPILVMLALKPPTVAEGLSALRALAWSVSVVLVVTFLLEVAGVLSEKYQPSGIIEFDEQYYWLPVNDLLGIEGRWPGPFGHNGYTAMMGAFIIVIASAAWSRSSWVFLGVGAFSLLVTSGRASAGAAAAGIVIIGMLTQSEPLARISRPIRLILGGLALVLGAVVMFMGKSGLTGRQNIWPGFVDLWQTSPWVGVGTSGVAVSGGVTQEFGHAHSLYLDLLARYGLITLVMVVGALTIGVGIAVAAGLRGVPGPLAIMVTYLVTGVTEPRNDWVHPGTNVLMVVVCVTIAGAAVSQAAPGGAPVERGLLG